MATKDLMCIMDDDPFRSDWKGPRASNQEEFVLTKVVGLTNISKNALDCNQVTGYVAFPASCMLVLLDPKTNDQKFIKSPSGKSISCVSFSDDGKLVAIGEVGVKPCVSVRSLRDFKEQGKFIVDHSVGVKTIALHPKSTYLVLIGIQDLTIGVWDYIRCQRLALTKWQTVPLSLTIPRSGASVILCGHRKITLFNLDKVNSNSYETNVFEEKKAILLGRQSEYTFVDITSGKGKFDKNVYTVTTCGYLCEIRLGDILIDKAIKVDTHAFCIRFGLNHVFVGCCEGVVKICIPDTLNVVVAVSLDQLLGSEAFPQTASKLYLDTTAIAINEKDSVVTCIYSNCSIYSWQINSFSKNIECSVLLPSGDDQLDNSELDACINESVCKANMFRSFMGCVEFNKESRLFDTETHAARNGLRCHHDLVHVIKGSSGKNQHVTSYRFSPDGRDFICGNEAGEIKVYDATTGVLRRVIEAHSAQVMCIELLYDDEYQLVCTGGRDRIIFILNAKTDFCLVQVLCDHSAAITAISLVSHDGLLTLVSAAADNLILVRRAAPGNSLKFTVTGQIVESRCNKALNVTGDYIITGDKNGNIKLFKADPIFNPKLSKTLKSVPKGNQISSIPKPMCMDPTGSFIATSQNNGQIVVYHLYTGQPITTLSAQCDATAIQFTSCLRYMISSTSNGCTMIWKVPERMSEFMISKRNKSFQIEVAKEVSYETTYVSCVKVCKELSNRDSSRENARGPNSNHSYGTDATPSIESLSFLRVAQDGEYESEVNSICSTESYISCSTCRDSCSDTVHWCPSYNSSVQTNSATECFCFGKELNLCNRIVEDSECKKLGPFIHSDEDLINKTHKKDEMKSTNKENSRNESEKITAVFSAKNEYNNSVTIDCITEDSTSGIQVSADCVQEGLNDLQSKKENAEQSIFLDAGLGMSTADFSGMEYKPSELIGKKVASATTEIMTTNITRVEAMSMFSESVNIRGIQEQRTDVLKPSLASATSDNSVFSKKITTLNKIGKNEFKVLKNTEDDGGQLQKRSGYSRSRKELGIPPSSPGSMRKALKNISPNSAGSYKTACSPKPTTSLDTSCSPGNSIFYSPSPYFSSEGEDTGCKLAYKLGSGDKEMEKPCGVSHQLDFDRMYSYNKITKHLSKNTSNAMNEPSNPEPSSSISCDMVNPTTSKSGPGVSFFPDHQTTYRNDEKQRHGQVPGRKSLKKALLEYTSNTGTSFKNSLNADTQMGLSCMNKIEPTVKTFEITAQHGHQLADNLSPEGKILQKYIIPVDDKKDMPVNDKKELPDNESNSLINCEISDEEAVYNYHSISRDESGKLILVAKCKNILSPHFSLKSPPVSNADKGHGKPVCDPYSFYQEPLSRGSQNNRGSLEDKDLSPLPDSSSIICDLSESSCMIFDSLNIQNNKANYSFKENDVTDKFQEKTAHEESTKVKSVKDISEKRLQEYFSELRKCLQLTNSQETVYKLACDVHDHELSELLEFVMKRRPTAYPETLPADELKVIRRNFVESDQSKQQTAGDKTMYLPTKQTTSPCNVAKMPSKKDSSNICEPPTVSRTAQLLEHENNQKAEKESKDQSALDGGESSQSTANAIINIVGQMLTTRRVANEQLSRSDCSFSGTDKNPVVSTQGLTDITNKSKQGVLTSVSPRQNISENDSLSQTIPVKSMAQQYMLKNVRNNKNIRGTYQLDTLMEKGEDSDSFSESRYGQVRSSRTVDSGIESSVNTRASSTKFSQPDETDLEYDKQDSSWVSLSREMTARFLKAGDRSNIANIRSPSSFQQLKYDKDGLSSDTAKTLEDTRESRPCRSSFGDRKYPPPIVELFRDQDDYLKKLKEVREKFEMSIQALSKERKSRLAEEERQMNK